MSDDIHRIDDVPVMTGDEVHRLAYCVREEASTPDLFNRFAAKQAVDAKEFFEMLNVELRGKLDGSDESEQILMVALQRLRKHPDIE